jgi:hypothetical protein
VAGFGGESGKIDEEGAVGDGGGEIAIGGDGEEDGAADPVLGGLGVIVLVE